MDSEKRSPERRAQDADRHVGRRMRQRRIMLGLTQQQFAELISVTYQQAHKYEKGVNRVAAGRLYEIAQALGVEVGYFFEGFGEQPAEATVSERQTLELFRTWPRLTANRRSIILQLVLECAGRTERLVPRYGAAAE